MTFHIYINGIFQEFVYAQTKDKAIEMYIDWHHNYTFDEYEKKYPTDKITAVPKTEDPNL